MKMGGPHMSPRNMKEKEEQTPEPIEENDQLAKEKAEQADRIWKSIKGAASQ